MVNESRSFRLKSHPDRLLKDHLAEVNTHAQKLANSITFLENREELKTLLEIIVYCHDFGKASGYFQRKLYGNLESDELGEHGLISALFGYYIVNQKSFESLNANFANLATYNIIKHHHGNLRNLEKGLDTEGYGYLKKILTSIEENEDEVKAIYSKILSNPGEKIGGFAKFLDNILSKPRFRIKGGSLFTRKQEKERNQRYFFTFNLLYSLLLEGDKKSASGSEEVRAEFNPSEEFISEYKKSFDFDNEFNQIREKIYQEVISNLEESWQNEKFFEVDAPTGSGKTLTLLGSAFKLREKLKKEKGQSPKIIYALPFISIIQQNYEVFKDVIEESSGQVGSDILLEHHHLADEVFAINGEEVNYSQSSFLIENWYSEIVVTTFYQLFNSVYTNKNHLLKKYNKLTDAIILIDEIQAIPPSLFQSVRDFFKLLVEECNTRIIIGTATQPQLNRDDETKENKLTPTKLFSPATSERISKVDLDNYFNRYRLNTNYLDQDLTLKELEELMANHTDLNNFMVVLNTINSTKELYRNLKNDPELREFDTIYLSTNIPPVTRSRRIKKAKNMIKNDKKFVLITTQLIEAGVDISLEAIIRDLAPLDNIVQAAGRTNRNNEKDLSQVFVVDLVDPDNDNRSFSSYIYDKILLSRTKNMLLKNPEKIEEKELYRDFLPEYFKKMINNEPQGIFESSDGNKIDLKEEICGLNYVEIDRYFSIIQDNLPEISCYIVQDEKDRKIWNDYVEISQMSTKNWEDYIEKQKTFSEIKKDFNRRIVTLKTGSEKEKIDLTHKIISLSQGEDFQCNEILRIDSDNKELFDEEIGITVKENDQAMII